MTFIDFARSNGIEINYDRFLASDKINRCGTTTNPRSKNGAWFWDGQRGWVMDWSADARTHWYNDPNAKPWTPEEKALWNRKRASAASEREQQYLKAYHEAYTVLKSAKIEKHAYLQYKGFRDAEGLVLDDVLLIPMRNVVTNKLQGYQAIFYDMDERKYQKKMQIGMRAKNAVFRLGAKDTQESWLVEGYATGLSVEHALKMCGIKATVVVCFSAGNLISVANQIQGKRFVFADNDASETGQKAAEATKLPWVMADQVGYDANDLEVNEGVFAVVEKIMSVRNRTQEKI